MDVMFQPLSTSSFTHILSLSFFSEWQDDKEWAKAVRDTISRRVSGEERVWEGGAEDKRR